jgi:hypothetical protein
MALAPRAMARLYGLPRNPTLVRLLGLRDVAIGAGILRRDPERWIRYRTLSDAFDVGMIGYRVARGPDRPVAPFLSGLALLAVLGGLTRRPAVEAHPEMSELRP